MIYISLQSHHNECDCVSVDWRLGCLLNRLFRRRSKKTSKLRVTGLCEGNPAVTSNGENVSIKWRHNISSGVRLSGIRRGLWWGRYSLFPDGTKSYQNQCRLIIISVWWRHQMETFSALLVICAGNSPVPGEFPTQRPVTRSFDVFFDLHPNKRLSKQWWGWWFETLSCPLWRHRNGSVKITWGQYHTKCSWVWSVIFVLRLHFQNYHIPQGLLWL